jgi:metallophosphoesterase (TIGR00282 family)
MNDLDAAKRAAREAAFARRRGLDAEAAGWALAGHVLSDLPAPPGAVVSGFWPLGEEIDIRPLLHALHARGHKVALPVTPGRGEALTFRGWQPGDALVPASTIAPCRDFRAATAWAAPLPRNRWTPCRLAPTTCGSMPSPPRTASSGAGADLRILFLGDVLGRTGRDAVAARLPELRRDLRIDLAVVNAENASHGFGLAPDMARALFAAGADVITLGNHAWDRKEIIPYIAETPRLLRPLNFPPGTPGNGSVLVTLQDGRKALVLQAMGRLYMDPLDCPFRGTAEILAKYRLGASVQAIVADIHAEASSEKMAYGHIFDGQMSFVVGTHTHCPTADAQILPGGTAFQSDAGMCGDYDSVIGMVKDGATLRFWRKMPGEKLGPAEGEATVCGVFVETDDVTGLARRIEPVRIGGRLAQAMPTV